VPRADLTSAAAGLDRLVVPGADAARHADTLRLPDRLTPTYLHDRTGFAFDGALRDIAATYDVATARWVAKSLQLSGVAWPWGLTLRPILIAAGAAALTVLAIRLWRRRRPAPPAPSSSDIH
jgi:hypothetical protein